MSLLLSPCTLWLSCVCVWSGCILCLRAHSSSVLAPYRFFLLREWERTRERDNDDKRLPNSQQPAAGYRSTMHDNTNRYTRTDAHIHIQTIPESSQFILLWTLCMAIQRADTYTAQNHTVHRIHRQYSFACSARHKRNVHAFGCVIILCSSFCFSFASVFSALFADIGINTIHLPLLFITSTNGLGNFAPFFGVSQNYFFFSSPLLSYRNSKNLIIVGKGERNM